MTRLLDQEADRVRASGALGRSGPLLGLFDFLVAAANDDRAPTETEIATAAFGKPDSIDLGQDATVRVYIHRLRRKLDGHYAAHPGATRIDVPRGSYRLVLTAPEPATPVRPGWRLPGALPWRTAAALILLNVLVWALIWPRTGGDEIERLRRSAPWAAILADKRPLIIVLGDYYIFAESDPRRGVDRLVREYRINSHADLSDWLMTNPDKAATWHDLDLSYLPTGTAFALRDLLPLLVRSDADRARSRIVLASAVTSTMLTDCDIVYVGYFSGLGQVLRNPVFAGSRLTVGSSWDELVDTVSGQSFRSGQGGPDRHGVAAPDYGYVSAFAGVSGNRFVIVAGTRDAAVMQSADAATNAAALAEQQRVARGADAYEALYDVDGIDRVNIGGKLIFAAPLATGRIWTGSDKGFPAG